MDKTQAQTLARKLATDLAAALAWVAGEFAEGDTWEQNDTSDFAIRENRNAPGVWCVVEYDDGTPVFCHTSPEACFPLA